MPSPCIEKFLELKQLDLDRYASVATPLYPPGSRGIYGGTFIAHCLSAAQKTVSTKYMPYSMHCNFLSSGNPNTNIVYHVKRTSDDDFNIIRTVRAIQNDKCIFIALLSFRAQEHSPKQDTSRREIGSKPPGLDDEDEVTSADLSDVCPYICSKVELLRSDDGLPENVRVRQWLKTRDPINSDLSCHMAALAYMSDNYLLPATSRVHNILWPGDPELQKQGQIRLESRAAKERVTFIVSLDHSVYFYNTAALQADDWIFTEMETSWTGDGRTLTFQNIFQKDGTLLATVLQEGVFRTEQLKPSL